jgi:hypothetical protein
MLVQNHKHRSCKDNAFIILLAYFSICFFCVRCQVIFLSAKSLLFYDIQAFKCYICGYIAFKSWSRKKLSVRQDADIYVSGVKLDIVFFKSVLGKFHRLK